MGCHGSSGADVQELADAGLLGQVPDGPHHEPAVLDGGGAHGRERGGDRVAGCLVGGKWSLPPSQ
jgi:hypothetical protein